MLKIEIEVCLLPTNLRPRVYEGLILALKTALTTAASLGEVKDDEIAVLMPRDLCRGRQTSELVVHICGQFDDPRGTMARQEQVCGIEYDTLVGFASRHMPNCKRITVMSQNLRADGQVGRWLQYYGEG